MNHLITPHPLKSIRALDGKEREICQILAKQPGGLNLPEIERTLSAPPSHATLARWVKTLIDKGLVVKTGSTKAARFRLSDGAQYWLTDPRRRPVVDFDSARIRDYRPNQTQWLSEGQRKIMATVTSRHAPLDATTYSQKISEAFLIDLSWASSSLEGNTYTRLNTEALIKFGQEANDDADEARMILNHKRAIGYILDQVSSESAVIERKTIGHIHGHLMRGFLAAPALGQARNSTVKIGGSSYRPSDDYQLMESMLGEIAWKAEQINDPMEASFFLLASLSYLQAFEDGNKRTSRLMCNLPLLRAALPPMSFVDIDKEDYISGLVDFYETGDTRLLGDAFAIAYQAGARLYEVSVSGGRPLRSVERKYALEIESAVSRTVKATLEGRKDNLKDLLEKVPVDNREDFIHVVDETLDSLNENTAEIWGVSQEDLRKFRQAQGANESPKAAGQDVIRKPRQRR